jgi:hypothetical protein
MTTTAAPLSIQRKTVGAPRKATAGCSAVQKLNYDKRKYQQNQQPRSATPSVPECAFPAWTPLSLAVASVFERLAS